MVLSPSPNTTVFVPVKHDECVIVHASDFVVPAETVVPELDVGSPVIERLEVAYVSEYDVRILDDWEFWTFTVRLVDCPCATVTAEAEPDTESEEGATNSMVSVVDDFEPPDHVSVTWYV